MKDSLFEMLLSLFEQTLTQIKEKHVEASRQEGEQETSVEEVASGSQDYSVKIVRAAHATSMRVFTWDEQLKLSKTSYQFLVRMASWGVINDEVFELIMNRLVFSESHFVGLQETKWAIRQTLADILDAKQLAFLDLVLYHKEDALPLH